MLKISYQLIISNFNNRIITINYKDKDKVLSNNLVSIIFNKITNIKFLIRDFNHKCQITLI